MTTTYAQLLVAVAEGNRFRKMMVHGSSPYRASTDRLQIDLGGCTEATVIHGRDGVWRLASTNTYGNYSGAVTGPTVDASGVHVTDPTVLRWIIEAIR